MPSTLPSGDPWPSDGKITPLRNSGSFHAYIHVPFCEVRCGYCDFNTYTALELGGTSRGTFEKYLIEEISYSKMVLDLSEITLPALESVFFGGGTPSLLSSAQIGAILQSLREVHGLAGSAEVTIEANPESTTERWLSEIASHGVNRISFGVQSFDKNVLKVLDRAHDAKKVREVVAAAKRLGLRVSVDLIYGAPGEDLDSWRRTVEQAVELDTEHVSAYSLIVEPGTRLSARIARGELAAVDEDFNADKHHLADERFQEAGLAWYEVSNWGNPSIHNRAYWYSKNWWGFGPGAHSHIAGTRFWNRKHPDAYRQSLSATPIQAMERISDRVHAEERLLLELRCATGTDIELLNQLGVDKQKVAELLAQGLLQLLPDRKISVTASGRLLADRIVLDLLP